MIRDSSTAAGRHGPPCCSGWPPASGAESSPGRGPVGRDRTSPATSPMTSPSLARHDRGDRGQSRQRGRVALHRWQNGWTSGFLVESLRISYDPGQRHPVSSGVQTYSIAGNADGNGRPRLAPTPRLAAAGGINPLELRRRQILVDGRRSPTPRPAAGPSARPRIRRRHPGRQVDRRHPQHQRLHGVDLPRAPDRGLAYSYGTILNNHVGSARRSTRPPLARPNFEFALTNFEQDPGLQPDQRVLHQPVHGLAAGHRRRQGGDGLEPRSPARIPGSPGRRITTNGGPINPPQPFGPAADRGARARLGRPVPGRHDRPAGGGASTPLPPQGRACSRS